MKGMAITMEKKTVGKFISALRRASGMTQKELGERLFVSDKTVSRWERDECAPDLSLIPAIAEIFGITADELLRGERNPAADTEDHAARRQAKSEKQFRLMLHTKKKSFTNLSLISVGLIIVGVIAAMICNLGFSRGLLGFCLASLFFAVAAICQSCFTVSFRLLIDEEETEYTEEIRKANSDMVFSSAKIFFGILLTLAFCLPIAVLVGSYQGLTFGSWLPWGALFAAAAFLPAFCVYKIFILKELIRKEIVWLDEKALSRATADRKLLGKICTVFALVFIIILLSTYAITSFVSESTFIERERFDDPDQFIAYMQNGYDTWYEEGYGDSPAPPHIDPEYSYPNKKWAEIDGKKYYYNPILYESIRILEHEDGGWEIVVTTDEANRNGEAMYFMLSAGLLSLHAINPAVCIAWYLTGKKKHSSRQR